MAGHTKKPAGGRSYDSIPVLPGSRKGPGDYTATDAQVEIATAQSRPGDRVRVTEKLDGTTVAVAIVRGEVVPLNRAGNRAECSPYEEHRMFARWVQVNRRRFQNAVREGERICGEWLALAHGTVYDLRHEPFVAFDLIRGPNRGRNPVRVPRVPYDEFLERAALASLVTPHLIHDGDAIDVASVMSYLDAHQKHPHVHGAVDAIDGAVWRVEHDGAIDFLAKYCRPEKEQGKYLPETGGGLPVWLWRPKD